MSLLLAIAHSDLAVEIARIWIATKRVRLNTSALQCKLTAQHHELLPREVDNSEDSKRKLVRYFQQSRLSDYESWRRLP